MSADSAHQFKPNKTEKLPHKKGHTETPKMKSPAKYEKPSANKTRS